MFSPRAFGTDGESILVEAVYPESHRGISSPIRIPRNPFGGANPLLFYGGSRAPRSSQRDAYIDSLKKFPTSSGRIAGAWEEPGPRKRTREEDGGTENHEAAQTSGGERHESLEYFPQFLPSLPFSFVREYTCVYVYTHVWLSPFFSLLFPFSQEDGLKRLLGWQIPFV